MRRITTDQEEAQSARILVYGEAGVGKTTLARTCPNPVIISAEAGLLSLRGEKIPAFVVEKFKDVREAVKAARAEAFTTVVIDSLSEIASILLGELKAKEKDHRRAYGEMHDRMLAFVRYVRDVAPVVLCTSKMERAQDERGVMLFGPAAPGKQLARELPYQFDIVMPLRLIRDPETGEVDRWLLTAGDGEWLAKDRSGKLDKWMPPDIGAILERIGGDEHGQD